MAHWQFVKDRISTSHMIYHPWHAANHAWHRLGLCASNSRVTYQVWHPCDTVTLPRLWSILNLTITSYTNHYPRRYRGSHRNLPSTIDGTVIWHGPLQRTRRLSTRLSGHPVLYWREWTETWLLPIKNSPTSRRWSKTWMSFLVLIDLWRRTCRGWETFQLLMLGLRYWLSWEI